MEYYSRIKKNSIMLFAGKWMELRLIRLSEISQDQKAKYYMFLLTCVIYTYHEYYDCNNGT
jgi:hypothetical protein